MAKKTSKKSKAKRTSTPKTKVLKKNSRKAVTAKRTKTAVKKKVVARSPAPAATTPSAIGTTTT